MPRRCIRIALPDGGVAIATVDARWCTACRRRAATLQCDHPDPGRRSGTCDRHLCSACARHQGGQDYCPHHPWPPPRAPHQAELL